MDADDDSSGAKHRRPNTFLEPEVLFCVSSRMVLAVAVEAKEGQRRRRRLDICSLTAMADEKHLR